MMKHITSNITRWFYMLLAVPMLTACLVCCSESSHIGPEIEPEKPDDNHDTEYPMSFAASDNSGVTTRATVTPLATNFMVSAYKNYSNGAKLVMDKYKAEYKQDLWNNVLHWDYTVVDGQYIKYWDYSNFPYRFHAIAPCPDTKDGFVLSANQLTIPNDKYNYQTCADGVIDEHGGAPQYYVAQVQRENKTSDTDKDIITGETITYSAGNDLNRVVTLVFHHLTNKVRFGIYSTTPWTTANKLYISNFKAEVVSDNFITNATGYTTTTTSGSFRDNGTFTGITKGNKTLLTYTGGKGKEECDLSKFQGQTSAFFFNRTDGLRQLPQKNVTVVVSFDLVQPDGTVFKQYKNVPVKYDDNNAILNWNAGYLYTYYLVINEIDKKLEIEFTATLTPWENVSAELSTDLEK